MTRNQTAGTNPVRVRFVEFELDEANASLLRDGKPLALAPTPFALLCALARKPGSLLTKDALLDEVWGHQFVSESVLKTAVSDLRTALGDDPRQPRLIETVPRKGYRFIAKPSELVAASAAPPLAPAAIAAEESLSFVGRADALARLKRAWNGACAGQRTVVWIAGEPGIGKTTLIDRFVTSLGDVACARGHCVEHYGTGEPYLPVLEAIGELCRRDPAAPALLRAIAPAWLLQLPWLSTPDERDALRRELAGVGPERMMRELAELGDRYAERRPLLIVLEDLHWSDRSTIQLLDYLARRRGGARVMWLGTFRLAEIVAGDHPLNRVRHELRLHRLCDEIVLDPFSEKEVADYVAGQSAALAADEAFVRALHERTDGVPLFVGSVLGEVMEQMASGDAEAAAAAAIAAMPVPENLAAIIEHFLARLADDDRAILATAAVCSGEFGPDAIAEAMEREGAWVAAACERQARSHMWLAATKTDRQGAAPDVRYAFRHALLREVLYERTPPVVRAQLHCKIGEALVRERERGQAVAASELAMHFDRGGELLKALGYYAEAAKAALANLSPSECMSLTARALAVLDQAPPDPQRDALDITLSTYRGIAAFNVLGPGAKARDALMRAYGLLERVPRHPSRGQLLHGLGILLFVRAEYAQALAVADRAAALSAATDDPVLLVSARTVQGQVHMMQGRPVAARDSVEQALPAMDHASGAAQQSFVAVPQVILLSHLALQLLHLGLVRQARVRLREAHALAQQERQPMSQLYVLWFDALIEIRLGNATRVAKLAGEMQALVEDSALVQGRAAAAWFRGWAQARQGDPRGGHGLIRAAYEANVRIGMQAGSSETLGYAAEALLLAGDTDAAERELREALRVAEAQGERVYLPQLFVTEAAIARARGQADAADASLRRALEEARAQQAPWHELACMVELCQHGRPKRADRHALAALLERLTEVADTPLAAKARALLSA